MPISKTASRDHKEDTWRPEELERSLKGVEKGGGSKPPPRSRDHRGVADNRHPVDDGSTFAAASESKSERHKSRRSEDPVPADSDRSRQQRGSRAAAPADAEDERHRSDGRRRADAANDGERPRRHRREGDDAVTVDPDGDSRSKRRGDDGGGERRDRRVELEARGGGGGGGDDEEDERRRRRREERSRREEERGGGGNDGDDDRRHRRRRTEDDGGGGIDGDDDRRHRRRRTEDEGGGGGGGGGEHRRRRDDEEGALRDVDGGDRRSSKRGGDGGEDDDERRRRHEERRRRRRDGADGENGGDGGRRPEEQAEEDAERRRRERRREREREERGGGGSTGARRDDDEADRERRHKRAAEGDGEAQAGHRDRRTRRHDVVEAEPGGGERDKESGGHRRRRDERDPDRDADDGERSHRRRSEAGGEDQRGGGRRHRDGGGKEEREEEERRRQEKEHRRRARDSVTAAADEPLASSTNGARRDKAAEQLSVTSGSRVSSSGRAANDPEPGREIFRSRNSRHETADCVEDEAIESRALSRDSHDVPVLKLGAATSGQHAYDEDFEDYDEDFEEADDEDNQKSSGSAKLGNLTSREVDDLFEAMNRENDRLLAESRNSSSRDSQKRDHSRTAEKDRGSGGRPGASGGGGAGGRHRGVINFVSAKQRELSNQVSSRARKRGKELLQIVELDSVFVDLFEMAPVKEYELYMRSFGRTNSRQVYVQTNADSIERDIQTEEIESDTKWTQHPADDSRLCCGGGSSSRSASGAAPFKTTAADRSEDVVSLMAFLQRSSQVIETLLVEGERHATVERTPEQRSASGAASRYSFSDGFVSLGVDAVPALKGRDVTTCCFSPSQPSMLLTGHSMPRQGEVDATALSACGLVCLWNANNPKLPIRLLAAAEQPTCCCFGPLKTSLVFAGMLDGSVVAWDLRDGSTIVSGAGDGRSPTVLYPAYCTAGVLRRGEGHASAIAALLPVLSDGRAARASGGTTSQGTEGGGAGLLSFQLASLEQSGTVSMWVVADVGRDLSSSNAGIDGGISAAAAPGAGGSALSSDLGLAPGARVKLLKSSGIRLTSGSISSVPPAASPAVTMAEARKSSKPGDSRLTSVQQADQRMNGSGISGESLRATAMQLDPANTSRLFVGTDVGSVLHAMRYGGEGRRPGSVQRWRSYSATCHLGSPADAASGSCTPGVTAMDVSPFLPLAAGLAAAGGAVTSTFASASLLLVGCADGSVRLHTPLLTSPVATLPPPPPATHGGSGIRSAQWSRTRPTVALVLDGSSVLHTWDLAQSDATPVKSDALTDGTRRAVGFALSEVDTTSTKPRMALCFSNGTVDLHTLAIHFGPTSKTGDGAEVEQLLKYIDSL